MKVYDHKFNGYSDARNFSLSQANCNWIIVLDADELLPHEKPLNCWEVLETYRAQTSSVDIFRINPVHLIPEGRNIRVPWWSQRFFAKGSLEFIRTVQEIPFRMNNNYQFELEIIPQANIYHFLPSENALKTKEEEWYNSQFDMESLKPRTSNFISPSETLNFSQWKSYNPQRDNYC